MRGAYMCGEEPYFLILSCMLLSATVVINTNSSHLSPPSLLLSLPPLTQVFTSSDAVLQIASRLKQPFPQLAKLAKAIIPHDIRDTLYHFVSSNRHLLAGEKDSCRIPSESEMERFLDQ